MIHWLSEKMKKKNVNKKEGARMECFWGAGDRKYEEKYRLYLIGFALIELCTDCFR